MGKRKALVRSKKEKREVKKCVSVRRPRKTRPRGVCDFFHKPPIFSPWECIFSVAFRFVFAVVFLACLLFPLLRLNSTVFIFLKSQSDTTSSIFFSKNLLPFLSK